MREERIEKIARRTAYGVVAAGIGLIISLLLFLWIEVTSLAVLIAIPIACGIAGFVGGDKTLEVLEDVLRGWR